MKKNNHNKELVISHAEIKRIIPPLVVSRAKSVGAVGEAWLAILDHLISELEKKWHISVGETLSGGTHAFVAYADGKNGEKYVLKIDMPENLGGEFSRSIKTLKIADGQGYSKLYAYDMERKACLLERMGKPINQLGYSVKKQLEIICSALKKIWEIPAANEDLPSGNESIAWFREFIGETWKKLNHPCPSIVIEQAFSYLQSREEALNPSEFVLLHGDAHGGNTLKALSGDTYKLIDPDGIFYEKAYDLGVLMREWIEEYEPNPLEKGKQRCMYLHHLTRVPEQAIWEWGYLQTISTAFVLLQIGQEETGHKMLHIAECWAYESIKAAEKSKYMNELTEFLTADGIRLRTEKFDMDIIHTFYKLRNLTALPIEVKKLLDKKEPVIAKYRERLEQFSVFCKIDKKNFHITHGDAGGNCLLNGSQLSLIDWDTVMSAPIERDAWIYICDKRQLNKINAVLKENEVDYALEQNLLCYYCYYFFFYYMTEYLKSIAEAKNEEQKTALTNRLSEYFTDSWIYKRLNFADTINVPP